MRVSCRGVGVNICSFLCPVFVFVESEPRGRNELGVPNKTRRPVGWYSESLADARVSGIHAA